MQDFKFRGGGGSMNLQIIYFCFVKGYGPTLENLQKLYEIKRIFIILTAHLIFIVHLTLQYLF